MSAPLLAALLALALPAKAAPTVPAALTAPPTASLTKAANANAAHSLGGADALKVNEARSLGDLAWIDSRRTTSEGEGAVVDFHCTGEILPRTELEGWIHFPQDHSGACVFHIDPRGGPSLSAIQFNTTVAEFRPGDSLDFYSSMADSEHHLAVGSFSYSSGVPEVTLTHATHTPHI